MPKILDLIVIFLCYIAESVADLSCYPDYCHSLNTIVPTPGVQCLLTKVQRGEDCVKYKFETSSRSTTKRNAGKFVLRAYVADLGMLNKRATAFNFSIIDANFHKLVTRYRNLWNEDSSACRRIELYGNETSPLPGELYVSCPFADDSYESSDYRLEYLATGDGFEYAGRYIFNVPSHGSMDEGIGVHEYKPFTYVDVSDEPILSLNVQPLPERYNVTKYKVWLINNDTNSATYVDVVTIANEQSISYNFTAYSGVYYFNVAALHPDCGKYGCVNGTTPFIIIKETSHRLLIMIISTVWIPPVILYALYHLYKLYRKEVSKRRKRPNCLLIYSPSRLSHINVMIDFAKYLRACNVNAMIDILDVADATGKDPDFWCESAFLDADVVLVATSPPAREVAASIVYRSTDDRLLRLIRENYSRKERRYYIVQFPYCKPDDVPEETRQFKRFCLPKELTKLVKAIRNKEHGRRVAVPDNEFLDSIKLAKLEISEEDAAAAKESEETGLLTSRGAQERPASRASIVDTPEGNVISRSFATNIDELNLLGENGEGGGEGAAEAAVETEGKILANEPSTRDGSFRIDQLDL